MNGFRRMLKQTPTLSNPPKTLPEATRRLGRVDSELERLFQTKAVQQFLKLEVEGAYLDGHMCNLRHGR